MSLCAPAPSRIQIITRSFTFPGCLRYVSFDLAFFRMPCREPSTVLRCNCTAQQCFVVMRVMSAIVFASLLEIREAFRGKCSGGRFLTCHVMNRLYYKYCGSESIVPVVARHLRPPGVHSTATKVFPILAMRSFVNQYETRTRKVFPNNCKMPFADRCPQHRYESFSNCCKAAGRKFRCGS